MKLDAKAIEQLYKSASLTRGMAYSPYSGFTVGAAVLCESGEIYTGSNIENASYPAGICAERVALSKAISEGKKPLAIAVAGGKKGEDAVLCPPCGICLQFMSEFMTKECFVIFAENEVKTLGELLPFGFDGEKLK